jgi:dihydroneopterin aldolase
MGIIREGSTNRRLRRMLERFTEKARKSVVLAQEEAARLGHDYIGIEHLLLGLLRDEEGDAARVLNSLGVTLDGAREQVESIVGYGDGETGGQVPFTPRSKRALESALREALRIGHNYVDPEHILLGLMRESEGVAARVLSNLDTGPDKVRREVAEITGGQRTERGPAVSPEASVYARTLRTEMVRARVEGLLVHAHCGVKDEERALPQALRVDLEYMYRAEEGDELGKVVDYGAVLRDVTGLLEREEFRLLETGMRMVGWHVLNSFPAIWQVTVRVTKLHVPIARVVSGVSVEATFSR